MKIAHKARVVLGSVWDAAWYAINGFKPIAQMLGIGRTTNAGKTITVPVAMSCSVPYVCTKIITDSLSAMPLVTLQKKGDQRLPAESLPAYMVLKKRPNGAQTSKTFRALITHHALNYGNGFARIVRENDKPDGRLLGMLPMHPNTFRKKEFDNVRPIYFFSGADGKEIRLQDWQVFHLMGHSEDGLTGVGSVELGKESIAQLLAIEQYGATFFARGGMVAGMLKKHTPFDDDESRKQFRQDLEKVYEGNQGFHKKLILEGEFDYKPLGSNPTESQLVEARLSMVPEIARFYCMPPNLAGDLSRATFSNAEQQARQFVNVTLMPWMVAWEEEIERIVLTPREVEQGYFAKHNAAALLRGDFEARMKGYATQLQNGVVNINEVRGWEDLDPVEGGDAHHIQLNMQTVPGSGVPTTSETAQLAKISSGAPRAAKN